MTGPRNRSVSTLVSTVLLVFAGAVALHAVGNDRLFYGTLAILAASVWVNSTTTRSRRRSGARWRVDFRSGA